MRRNHRSPTTVRSNVAAWRTKDGRAMVEQGRRGGGSGPSGTGTVATLGSRYKYLGLAGRDDGCILGSGEHQYLR